MRLWHINHLGRINSQGKWGRVIDVCFWKLRRSDQGYFTPTRPQSLISLKVNLIQSSRCFSALLSLSDPFLLPDSKNREVYYIINIRTSAAFRCLWDYFTGQDPRQPFTWREEVFKQDGDAGEAERFTPVHGNTGGETQTINSYFCR